MPHGYVEVNATSAHVTIEPGFDIRFAEGLEGASYVREGNNLEIALDDASIVLANFFAQGEGAELPNFIFADGVTVSAKDFLEAQNPDMELTTAAGPASTPDSSGLSDYSDLSGTIVDGVGALDSLEGLNQWNKEFSPSTSLEIAGMAPLGAPVAGGGATVDRGEDIVRKSNVLIEGKIDTGSGGNRYIVAEGTENITGIINNDTNSTVELNADKGANIIIDASLEAKITADGESGFNQDDRVELNGSVKGVATEGTSNSTTLQADGSIGVSSSLLAGNAEGSNAVNSFLTVGENQPFVVQGVSTSGTDLTTSLTAKENLVLEADVSSSMSAMTRGEDGARAEMQLEAAGVFVDGEGNTVQLFANEGDVKIEASSNNSVAARNGNEEDGVESSLDVAGRVGGLFVEGGNHSLDIEAGRDISIIGSAVSHASSSLSPGAENNTGVSWASVEHNKSLPGAHSLNVYGVQTSMASETAIHMAAGNNLVIGAESNAYKTVTVQSDSIGMAENGTDTTAETSSVIAGDVIGFDANGGAIDLSAGANLTLSASTAENAVIDNMNSIGATVGEAHIIKNLNTVAGGRFQPFGENDSLSLKAGGDLTFSAADTTSLSHTSEAVDEATLDATVKAEVYDLVGLDVNAQEGVNPISFEAGGDFSAQAVSEIIVDGTTKITGGNLDAGASKLNVTTQAVVYQASGVALNAYTNDVKMAAGGDMDLSAAITSSVTEKYENVSQPVGNDETFSVNMHTTTEGKRMAGLVFSGHDSALDMHAAGDMGMSARVSNELAAEIDTGGRSSEETYLSHAKAGTAAGLLADGDASTTLQIIADKNLKLAAEIEAKSAIATNGNLVAVATRTEFDDAHGAMITGSVSDAVLSSGEDLSIGASLLSESIVTIAGTKGSSGTEVTGPNGESGAGDGSQSGDGSGTLSITTAVTGQQGRGVSASGTDNLTVTAGRDMHLGVEQKAHTQHDITGSFASFAYASEVRGEAVGVHVESSEPGKVKISAGNDLTVHAIQEAHVSGQTSATSQNIEYTIQARVEESQARGVQLASMGESTIRLTSGNDMLIKASQSAVVDEQMNGSVVTGEGTSNGFVTSAVAGSASGLHVGGYNNALLVEAQSGSLVIGAEQHADIFMESDTTVSDSHEEYTAMVQSEGATGVVLECAGEEAALTMSAAESMDISASAQAQNTVTTTAKNVTANSTVAVESDFYGMRVGGMDQGSSVSVHAGGNMDISAKAQASNTVNVTDALEALVTATVTGDATGLFLEGYGDGLTTFTTGGDLTINAALTAESRITGSFLAEDDPFGFAGEFAAAARGSATGLFINDQTKGQPAIRSEYGFEGNNIRINASLSALVDSSGVQGGNLVSNATASGEAVAVQVGGAGQSYNTHLTLKAVNNLDMEAKIAALSNNGGSGGANGNVFGLRVQATDSSVAMFAGGNINIGAELLSDADETGGSSAGIMNEGSNTITLNAADAINITAAGGNSASGIHNTGGKISLFGEDINMTVGSSSHGAGYGMFAELGATNEVSFSNSFTLNNFAPYSVGMEANGTGAHNILRGGDAGVTVIIHCHRTGNDEAPSESIALSANDGSNSILTGAGDDTITLVGDIRTSGGHNTIDAGAGKDTITLVGDILSDGGNNTINGGAGNDVIILDGKVSGGDENGRLIIDGGEGDYDILVLKAESWADFEERYQNLFGDANTIKNIDKIEYHVSGLDSDVPQWLLDYCAKSGIDAPSPYEVASPALAVFGLDFESSLDALLPTDDVTHMERDLFTGDQSVEESSKEIASFSGEVCYVDSGASAFDEMDELARLLLTHSA